jgi:hypothetical protein
MPFELPDEFAPRKTELSEATKKVYKGRLNSLAKLGLASNAEELRKNHKEVLAHLKEMNNGEEMSKVKVRGILTAILWPQPKDYREKKNPYYKYFQKVLPSKAGDDKWVPASKYVAE